MHPYFIRIKTVIKANLWTFLPVSYCWELGITWFFIWEERNNIGNYPVTLPNYYPKAHSFFCTKLCLFTLFSWLRPCIELKLSQVGCFIHILYQRELANLQKQYCKNFRFWTFWIWKNRFIPEKQRKHLEESSFVTLISTLFLSGISGNPYADLQGR